MIFLGDKLSAIIFFYLYKFQKLPVRINWTIKHQGNSTNDTPPSPKGHYMEEGIQVTKIFHK